MFQEFQDYIGNYIDPNVVNNILIPCLEPSLTDFNIGFYGIGYRLDEVKSKNACFRGACMGGYIEIVKKFEIKDPTDGLLSACIGCHKDIMKLMLENRAEIVNDCVFYTLKNDDMEAFQLLLDYGYNNYSYCLETACTLGNHRFAKFITEIDEDYNFNWRKLLCKASESGDCDVFKLIFEKSNYNDIILQSCFYRACTSLNPSKNELIKFLIDYIHTENLYCLTDETNLRKAVGDCSILHLLNEYNIGAVEILWNKFPRLRDKIKRFIRERGEDDKDVYKMFLN